MNDTLLMAIIQRIGNIANELGGFRLGEFLLLLEVLVQLSFRGEFQNEKDSLLIVKEPKQSQDVRVSVRFEKTVSPLGTCEIMNTFSLP